MYYDYHERVNRIVSHRILAINRAENEKVIAVNDINLQLHLTLLLLKCHFLTDQLTFLFHQLMFREL